jgi:hypothetical protein
MELVMNNLKKCIIGSVLAIACSTSQASYVDVSTHRAWRQLTDTVSLTWNQVATVCSSGTGFCNGIVAGIDFTGWTWASTDDVLGLFAGLGVPAGYEVFDTSGNSWIRNMVDVDGAIGPDTGAFYATAANSVIMGWDRNDTGSNPWAYASYVSDNGSVAHARIFGDNPKTSASSSLGVWLFADAPATRIAEPASTMLFAIACAALALVRRRCS